MTMIRSTVTGMVLIFLLATGGTAWAQDRQAPAAEQATPTTNDADGKAKTALPEQNASPHGTDERPGSSASRKAEEIK